MNMLVSMSDRLPIVAMRYFPGAGFSAPSRLCWTNSIIGVVYSGAMFQSIFLRETDSALTTSAVMSSEYIPMTRREPKSISSLSTSTLPLLSPPGHSFEPYSILIPFLKTPPLVLRVVNLLSHMWLFSIVPSKFNVPAQIFVSPEYVSVTLGNVNIPSPCFTRRISPVNAPPVSVHVKYCVVMLSLSSWP